MKKNMVIVGNPTITCSGEGRYSVIYADPEKNWEVAKYENLTFEEVSALPFISKFHLNFLR